MHHSTFLKNNATYCPFHTFSSHDKVECLTRVRSVHTMETSRFEDSTKFCPFRSQASHDGKGFVAVRTKANARNHPLCSRDSHGDDHCREGGHKRQTSTLTLARHKKAFVQGTQVLHPARHSSRLNALNSEMTDDRTNEHANERTTKQTPHTTTLWHGKLSSTRQTSTANCQ